MTKAVVYTDKELTVVCWGNVSMLDGEHILACKMLCWCGVGLELDSEQVLDREVCEQSIWRRYMYIVIY